MQLCCGLVCLACLSISYKASNPQCPNQHDLPNRALISPSYSKLDLLLSLQSQNSSFPPQKKKCNICKTPNLFPSALLTSECICQMCKENFNGKVINIPGLTCLNGHKMIENNMPSGRNNLCATCKRIVRDFSADCKKCNVSLCEECVNTMKLVLVNLKHFRCCCNGNLVWKWYKTCEKCAFCGKKFSDFGSFSCAPCGETDCFKAICISCLSCLEKHVKCAVCQKEIEIHDSVAYNSCKNCLKSLEVNKSNVRDSVEIEIPITSSALTDLKSIENLAISLRKQCKDHQFRDQISSTDACHLCTAKGENNKLWVCGHCYYSLCDPCRTWYSESKPIENDEIKCFHGHYLRITQNPEKIYKRNGVFLCDGCKFNSAKKSAHCRKCHVDLCNMCLKLLLKLLEKTTDVICRCDGNLVWNSKKVLGGCGHCSSKFSKCGAFWCFSCSTGYCIRCTYILQSLKCSLCIKFIQEQNLFLILICGHNMCLMCYSKLSTTSAYCCHYDGFPLSDSLTTVSDSYSLDLKYVKSLIFFTPGSFKQKINAQSGCDICPKETSAIWVFSDWVYSTCTSCKEFYETHPLYENPQIRCIQNHYLRKNLPSNKVMCDICKVNSNCEGITCKICKVDFCLKCVEILEFLLRNLSFFKCKCKGEIAWKHRRTIEKCSGCKKRFEKSGNFLCRFCENEYCVRCTYNLGLLKCEDCGKGDLKKPIAVDSLVFCENCFLSRFSNEEILRSTTENMLFPENLLAVSNSVSLRSGDKEKLRSFIYCKVHSYLKVLRNSEKCDVCKEKKNNTWICIFCSSLVCSPCKDWIDHSEILEISAIKCVKSHSFRVHKFNIPIEEYFCSGCNIKTSIDFAFCSSCKINLCVLCITNLKVLIKSLNQVHCCCKKELIWRYDKKCNNCKVCTGKFSKSGSFFCVTCNKTTCIRCAYIIGNFSNLFQ